MRNLYTAKQREIFLISSILLLFIFICYGLRHYLSAIFGSIILYLLFLPLYRILVNKRKWNPSFTSLLFIFISFILIVLPFLFLSVLLTEKILYYTSHFEEILVLIQPIERFTGIQLNDRATITSIATNLGAFMSKLFPSLVESALDLFIILGLMYFVMYYLLIKNKEMHEKVHTYLPFAPHTIDALIEELKASINANVLGLGIISLVQAALVGLGFWFFGLPDPLFWGLISFFAAFIPVLGTPMVWGPGGGYLIATGSTGAGIGLLIYGSILVMNIDNILRLYIAKKMGDTHPLITIIGVVLGVPMFGILGLVLGPLTISYLLMLVGAYEQEYRGGNRHGSHIQETESKPS